MTSTAAVCAVSDAVAALLPLLTAREQASLGGFLLANAGINDETVSAFIGELSDDDADELRALLSDD
jgi:hypothetical protein